MAQQSLGLIETIGLAAAIEAADAAVKSANVVLVGYELTRGDGMTVVKVQGDVGAVTAAVAAAAVAAAKVNRVVSTRVIARPAAGIEGLVVNADTVGAGRGAISFPVVPAVDAADSAASMEAFGPAPEETQAQPVAMEREVPVSTSTSVPVPEEVPKQPMAEEQQEHDTNRGAERITSLPPDPVKPVPPGAGGQPNHGRKRRKTKTQAHGLKGE